MIVVDSYLFLLKTSLGVVSDKVQNAINYHPTSPKPWAGTVHLGQFLANLNEGLWSCVSELYYAIYSSYSLPYL